MFGGTSFATILLAVAGVAGFAAGAVITRLLGSGATRPLGKRADELHHRIRALEADLRVAQRAADQAKTERQALTEELGRTSAELVALRDKEVGADDRIRKLKAEVQHECGKTARLRQELADRAEEMVRTHVQLRDVQNELGVSQVGSDVVIDEITRLERERDDLSTIVEALRREMAERPEDAPVLPAAGTQRMVDC